MDIIRGEQGEIRPCTSFSVRCGGTKDCHAEMRRRGDAEAPRAVYASGLEVCRAKREKQIRRKDAKAPRCRDFFASLRLAVRALYWLRASNRRRRSDTATGTRTSLCLCAPVVNLFRTPSMCSDEGRAALRAVMSAGHAFASPSPRLRGSACKNSRSRIDAGRNGHSAGSRRSRSGINNVKEPGTQGKPQIEQNMNILGGKVKPQGPK